MCIDCRLERYIAFSIQACTEKKILNALRAFCCTLPILIWFVHSLYALHCRTKKLSLILLLHLVVRCLFSFESWIHCSQVESTAVYRKVDTRALHAFCCAALMHPKMNCNWEKWTLVHCIALHFVAHCQLVSQYLDFAFYVISLQWMHPKVEKSGIACILLCSSPTGLSHARKSRGSASWIWWLLKSIIMQSDYVDCWHLFVFWFGTFLRWPLFHITLPRY